MPPGLGLPACPVNDTRSCVRVSRNSALVRLRSGAICPRLNHFRFPELPDYLFRAKSLPRHTWPPMCQGPKLRFYHFDHAVLSL